VGRDYAVFKVRTKNLNLMQQKDEKPRISPERGLTRNMSLVALLSSVLRRRRYEEARGRNSA